MNNFVETLNKLIKIINLSIDIDENQKLEWINMIESFKISRNFNLNILVNEIIDIDLNKYNAIFQKRVNKLSKINIVQYCNLEINYKENRNIDNTLAFLENFNENILNNYLKRVKKLKEKQGLIYTRQRSLKMTNIANNFSESEKLMAI